jgi:hypothetical protein
MRPADAGEQLKSGLTINAKHLKRDRPGLLLVLARLDRQTYPMLSGFWRFCVASEIHRSFCWSRTRLPE